MTNFIKRTFRKVWHSATQRVMSVTTMGMALALLADMLLAARLGTSTGADMIIIALTLPRMIEVIVREGTRQSMVALYMEIKTSRSLDDYRRFVSGMFNLVIVIGLIILIAGLLLAYPIVSIIGPGLSLEAKVQTTTLFRLAFPLVVFVLMQTALSVALNCDKRFSVVAVRNSVVSGIVVVLMLLSWDSDSFALFVPLGYTLGNALFLVVLLFYSASSIGFTFRLRAWPERSLNRKLLRSIAYPTAGFSLRQAARILERMLATLAGPGAVSAYYFAYRLFSAAQSIIGVSVVTTSTPTIAGYGVTGQKATLTRYLKRQIKRAALLALPGTIVVVLFAEPIVSIIYGRGKFDAASIAASSQILAILFLGFVFACITPLLLSTVYGLKKLRTAFILIMQSSIVHAISAAALFYLFGLPGLALAASAPRVYNSVRIPLYLRGQGVNLWGRSLERTERDAKTYVEDVNLNEDQR